MNIMIIHFADFISEKLEKVEKQDVKTEHNDSGRVPRTQNVRGQRPEYSKARMRIMTHRLMSHSHPGRRYFRILGFLLRTASSPWSPDSGVAESSERSDIQQLNSNEHENHGQ